MANPKAYQRNIFEIQKPVEVLFIYFDIKNLNSFSSASPFNGRVLLKNVVGILVCKVKHSEPKVFEEISKKIKPEETFCYAEKR